MKKRQREILNDLRAVCNQLGGILDGTSTNELKYRDRQEAHLLVSTVLYGVLCDDPENELAEEDIQDSKEALVKLQQLKSKVYPDRNGTY